jgi:hypothetical protein
MTRFLFLFCMSLHLSGLLHPARSTHFQAAIMMMIYTAIAIPGRVSATPCKQGNKQPVVLFSVPVKGRWQEDACKFNQSSNSGAPTIRYNCVRKCVQTMRYICAPFSSFIQEQPF